MRREKKVPHRHLNRNEIRKVMIYGNAECTQIIKSRIFGPVAFLDEPKQQKKGEEGKKKFFLFSSMDFACAAH